MTEDSRSSIQKIVDDTVDFINNMTYEQAQKIENDYWMRAYGTTDLAARGYKSFWD